MKNLYFGIRCKGMTAMSDGKNVYIASGQAIPQSNQYTSDDIINVIVKAMANDRKKVK